MAPNICNTPAVMLTEYENRPWKWPSLHITPKSLSYFLCWRQKQAGLITGFLQSGISFLRTFAQLLPLSWRCGVFNFSVKQSIL